jgi:mandelate racemase
MSGTIRSLRTRLVRVPLKRPLIAPTARIDRTTLLLLDLDCGDVTGRAYLHVFPDSVAPALRHLLAALAGAAQGEVLDPPRLHEELRRGFGLFGGFEGLLATALGGFDMAAWDAHAQVRNEPLAITLGGTMAPLPTYNSSGLGFMPPAALAEQVPGLLEGGFAALKMRLGYPTLAEDLAAIHAVRAAAPADLVLMAEFAQGFATAAEALSRLTALDGEGLAWFEDPLPHDDLHGHATLAAALTTPVQTGENFFAPGTVDHAARLGALDLVNFDLPHIGGITAWRKAAALAARAGLPVSSHVFRSSAVTFWRPRPTATGWNISTGPRRSSPNR